MCHFLFPDSNVPKNLTLYITCANIQTQILLEIFLSLNRFMKFCYSLVCLYNIILFVFLCSLGFKLKLKGGGRVEVDLS